MIFTSSYNDWQLDKYRKVSISGDRGKKINYQGEYYSLLAPKLSFWKIWHDNIGKIPEEENTKYYMREYYKQVLSKLDPQDVYNLIPDGSILLCYEDNDKFCHRFPFCFWIELFLGEKTSEVYENPRRETLHKLERPEYLKDMFEEIIREEYDMHGFDTIKEAYEYNKKYNIKEIEEKRRYKEELIEKGLYGVIMTKVNDKNNAKTLDLKLTS
jgi:hypothetical protein